MVEILLLKEFHISARIHSAEPWRHRGSEHSAVCCTRSQWNKSDCVLKRLLILWTCKTLCIFLPLVGLELPPFPPHGDWSLYQWGWSRSVDPSDLFTITNGNLSWMSTFKLLRMVCILSVDMAKRTVLTWNCFSRIPNRCGRRKSFRFNLWQTLPQGSPPPIMITVQGKHSLRILEDLDYQV
jgi:hypothetical protein